MAVALRRGCFFFFWGSFFRQHLGSQALRGPRAPGHFLPNPKKCTMLLLIRHLHTYRPGMPRRRMGMVSTASCAPCHKGKPLAMTSMRRSSNRLTMMLRSVLVVTRAPASRHTRAAARSNGHPRLRRAPDLAQAARWSPRGSRGRAGGQRQGETKAPQEEGTQVGGHKGHQG